MLVILYQTMSEKLKHTAASFPRMFSDKCSAANSFCVTWAENCAWRSCEVMYLGSSQDIAHDAMVQTGRIHPDLANSCHVVTFELFHWRVAGFAGGKLLADLFECTASNNSCLHQECRHRHNTVGRRPVELAFSQADDQTNFIYSLCWEITYYDTTTNFGYCMTKKILSIVMKKTFKVKQVELNLFESGKTRAQRFARACPSWFC